MKPELPVRAAIFKRRTYEVPSEGRSGKIRLDFNENTSGCSEAARRAIARLTAKELATYPEYAKSTAHIAKYFGVHSNEIALTNGGDDALRSFFDTFVESRSEILICEPTFPMYRYYAEIAGARVHALRYSPQMAFPSDEVLAALKRRPAVLFIANPNNPTGTLVGAAVLRKLLHAATHTAVVMDEAYSDFAGFSVVPWIRRYPQLFVAKTFSKAAGMAGLRLGAVIAQRSSLDLIKKVLQPYPINCAALAAAVAAIRERRAIQSYIRNVNELREWFAGELQLRGARVFPSAGNFVLVDFGERGDGIYRRLERKNILVRQRRHDLGPGFARITIGTHAELKKLLREIPVIAKDRHA